MSSWGTRLVTIGTSFAVAAGMGYHAYKSGALERALSKLTTTGFSKMIEFVQNEQNKMQREQDLYDWRTKIRNECRIRLKQLAPVISTKTGQKSVLAAIRSAKAAKGKGELSVAAWDKLGQAALTRIVVEVLLFAVLSVVITTVLHLLEAAEQTLQDRGTSLNVEIREKILKRLVEKQVLGIGLERLITDVSRAVCKATDGLDSGWCRGRSAHGEFMDLIRRCVCAFGKACEENYPPETTFFGSIFNIVGKCVFTMNLEQPPPKLTQQVRKGLTCEVEGLLRAYACPVEADATDAPTDDTVPAPETTDAPTDAPDTTDAPTDETLSAPADTAEADEEKASSDVDISAPEAISAIEEANVLSQINAHFSDVLDSSVASATLQNTITAFLGDIGSFLRGKFFNNSLVTRVPRASCLVRLGISNDLTPLSSALVEKLFDDTSKSNAMSNLVQMICNHSVFPM